MRPVMLLIECVLLGIPRSTSRQRCISNLSTDIRRQHAAGNTWHGIAESAVRFATDRTRYAVRVQWRHVDVIKTRCSSPNNGFSGHDDGHDDARYFRTEQQLRRQFGVSSTDGTATQSRPELAQYNKAWLWRHRATAVIQSRVHWRQERQSVVHVIEPVTWQSKDDFGLWRMSFDHLPGEHQKTE